MKTLTVTDRYIIGAFIFAILHTFTVIYFNGLVIFFTGMAIISHLKK